MKQDRTDIALTWIYRCSILLSLVLVIYGAIRNLDNSGDSKTILAVLISFGLFMFGQFLSRELDKSENKSVKDFMNVVRGHWEASRLLNYNDLSNRCLRAKKVILGSLSKDLSRPGSSTDHWPQTKKDLIFDNDINFTYYCAMQDRKRVELINDALKDKLGEGACSEMGGQIELNNTLIHLIPTGVHLGDFCNIIIIDESELYLVLPQNYGSPKDWLRTTDETLIKQFMAYLSGFSQETKANVWQKAIETERTLSAEVKRVKVRDID